MNMLKTTVSLLCLAASLPGIAGNSVIIRNALPERRSAEIVEVKGSLLSASDVFSNRDKTPFILVDSKGKEIPYQVTYDGALVFPADVEAKSSATYTLKPGTPAKVESYCYGRLFPERLDDMTWENDKCAYRAYGPALEKSGQKAYGYDIWCKSVSHPVVEERYFKHLHRNMSFHKNHGDGMDVYTVGPTLGAGTAALIDHEGNISYPWGFSDYKVLDNGPLRFTVSLTYPKKAFEGDSVAETRIITLDKGSWLNRTSVNYSGLTKPAKLIQGIVLHKESLGDFTAEKSGKYVSVVDFTDNPNGDNGEIYVGIVSPASSVFDFVPFPKPEGDAMGHVAAVADYSPGEDFTYWWGSGWSSGGIYDEEQWNGILADFSRRQQSPLEIAVE